MHVFSPPPPTTDHFLTRHRHSFVAKIYPDILAPFTASYLYTKDHSATFLCKVQFKLKVSKMSLNLYMYTMYLCGHCHFGHLVTTADDRRTKLCTLVKHHPDMPFTKRSRVLTVVAVVVVVPICPTLHHRQIFVSIDIAFKTTANPAPIIYTSDVKRIFDYL